METENKGNTMNEPTPEALIDLEARWHGVQERLGGRVQDMEKTFGNGPLQHAIALNNALTDYPERCLARNPIVAKSLLRCRDGEELP